MNKIKTNYLVDWLDKDSVELEADLMVDYNC